MYFAVPANFRFQISREGVYARYTHTVQTTGYFIGSLVELTAGVQHRQYYLQSWFTFFLMNIHGDTTAVVGNRDRVVLIDYHVDVCTISG